MKKTFNILFYIRRDKADSNGRVPIYCRITVNGERSELAIKRDVQVDRWIPNSQKVMGSNEESRSINAYINTVRIKINDHRNKLESSDKTVSAESIKNSYLGIIEGSKSLIAIFEEHNRKVKSLINKDFAAGTFERYETCLKHLKEFVEWKYKVADYYVEDVNHEFITELDYYLRSVKNCANNTTIKYIKNFKKIVRIALANGWITKDPFLNYKSKLEKIDRGYLTQSELDTLRSKTFSTTRLEQVKDIFVFQCFTGLAFSDVKSLSHANIVKDLEGELWINTHRRKTNTEVHVMLLPEAIDVTNKYRDDVECLYKGVLLPVLSNQKMNGYLKEIGDICGITKNLSTHLARHTFATTVTLAKGVSLESVSRMLGHTNLKTTQVYARMMDSRVATEMKVLRGKLSDTAAKSGYFTIIDHLVTF